MLGIGGVDRTRMVVRRFSATGGERESTAQVCAGSSVAGMVIPHALGARVHRKNDTVYTDVRV